MADVLFKDLKPGDIIFRLIEGKVKYTVVHSVELIPTKRGGHRARILFGKRSWAIVGVGRLLSHLEYWKPELTPEKIAYLHKKAGWSAKC